MEEKKYYLHINYVYLPGDRTIEGEVTRVFTCVEKPKVTLDLLDVIRDSLRQDYHWDKGSIVIRCWQWFD